MQNQRWFKNCGVLLIGSLFTVRIFSAQELDFRTDINPALLYFQAFQNIPQLSEADSKDLFDSPSGGSWPDRPFDERKLRLLKQYDNSFKTVRRARFARVPCDWGYDLSDGPEALLPGLAPARRISQVAAMRGVAALDANRFNDFRDDWAAAFVLGRNLSSDRILISCLVQIAMENLLSSAIAQNYYRLSADQLDEVIAIIDTAPKRGTIAETIGGTERDAFFGYILRKVNALIEQANGNNALFWQRFETFWNPIATDFESKRGPDPSAELVKEAAGGTTEGVLRLLNEMPAFYNESERVLALPYPAYKKESEILFSNITNSKNPFIRQFFSVLKNVRAKEFSAIVRREMLRAAAAYKRGGIAAFQAVPDPLIGGSFEFSRAQVDGVDRGFKLKCREPFRDFDEVLIFVEKPGKHFRLEGKNAGTSY